jgi:hypothetical protein
MPILLAIQTFIMTIFTAIWTTITTILTAIWTTATMIFTAIWNTVTTVFTAIWTTITTVMTAIWTTITTILTIIGTAFIIGLALIVGTVALVFQGIYTTISTIMNLVLTFLTSIWNAIYAAVAPVVQTMWTGIQTLFNAGYALISSVMATIQSAIVAVWNAIVAAVSPVVQTMWTTIQTLFNTGYTTISTLMTTIQTFLTTTWQAISDTVTPIIQAFWDWIVSAWTGIQTTTTEIFTAISEFLSTTWQAISDTVTPIIQAFWDFVVSAWDGVSAYTTEIFTAVSEFLTSTWQSISDAVTPIIQAIWDFVVEAWDGITSATTSFGDALYDAVATAFSEAVGEGGRILSGLLTAIADALDGLGVGADIASSLRGAASTITSVTTFKDGGVTGGHNHGQSHAGRGGMGTGGVNPRMHLWNEQVGPEAYVAKNGPKRQNMSYAERAVRWFGGTVLWKGAGGGNTGEGAPKRSIDYSRYSTRVGQPTPRAFCNGGIHGARCSCNGSLQPDEAFHNGGVIGTLHSFYCGGTNWDSDVAQIVSQLSGATGGCGVPNTYAGHPGGEGRSVDWWGGGCPGQLDLSCGNSIQAEARKIPDWTYDIWQGVSSYGGDYCAEDPSDCHYDHLHTTFNGAGGMGFGCTPIKTMFSAAAKLLTAPASIAAGALPGPIGPVAQYGVDTGVEAIVEWIVSQLPGCSGGGGDCMGQLPAALKQLGLEGTDFETMMPGLISCESGGDSGAINDYDSNAAAGTPSIGCTQMIQPTFDAHAASGCTDIRDPLCNLMASMNYQQSKYGGAVPGCPYLTGGIIPGHGPKPIIAHGGEAVISARGYEALNQLATAAIQWSASPAADAVTRNGVYGGPVHGGDGASIGDVKVTVDLSGSNFGGDMTEEKVRTIAHDAAREGINAGFDDLKRHNQPSISRGGRR